MVGQAQRNAIYQPCGVGGRSGRYKECNRREDYCGEEDIGPPFRVDHDLTSREPYCGLEPADYCVLLVSCEWSSLASADGSTVRRTVPATGQMHRSESRQGVTRLVGARPTPGSKYCRVGAEKLPSSRYRDQGTVHAGRSAVKGGDGRGPKAFDNQINAQRKFPD